MVVEVEEGMEEKVAVQVLMLLGLLQVYLARPIAMGAALAALRVRVLLVKTVNPGR